jgi:hypothetical protein
MSNTADPYIDFRARFIRLGAPAKVVRADGSLDEDWLDRRGWIERTVNGAATHRAIGFHRPWHRKAWGWLHYRWWAWRRHYRMPPPLCGGFED